METIKINKSNWSGEEGEVKLYADGKTFKVYDEKFRLVIKKQPATIIDGEEVVPAHNEYKVERKNAGPGWQPMDEKGHQDWCGIYGEENQGFVFTTWNGEMDRYSDKDPRIAAAKLYFNLI